MVLELHKLINSIRNLGCVSRSMSQEYSKFVKSD